MSKESQIIAEPDAGPSLPASWLLPGLALFMLFPVTLLIIGTGFDGLYGQDPFAYYNYAIGPLRSNLFALKPPPPFFWPPGYPILVALLSLFTGVNPLAGQLVSLIAGGLTPVFTALFAREIWDRKGSRWLVPLLAGLLVALTGQFWQSSIVVMADTTALASATLGMWALARYGNQLEYGGEVKFSWFGLAAASISFAVLTRWAYALVAIPSAIYAGILLIRQSKTRMILHAAAASIVSALVLWPVWLPVLELLFSLPGGASAFVGDLSVYSWSPVTAFRRVHDSPDGILQYRLPNGLYYALAPAHRFYFTGLVASLLLPGFWTVFRRRKWQRWLLLVGWIASIYLFHSGAAWQNFRFTLAYLPPMAIVAAIGYASLMQRFRPAGRWLLSLFLLSGLAFMSYGGWTLTKDFIAQKNAHLSTVRWAEAHMPSDAELITFEITLLFKEYSLIETHDIFFLAPRDIAGLLDSGRPTFLLLNLDSIGSQWRQKSPYSNYQWMKENAGLLPLGRHGAYSLFAVE